MLIRMIFEPEANVNCNHDRMFEYYSENYLSDFDTNWGGTIVMDNFSKKHINSGFKTLLTAMVQTDLFRGEK